MTVGGNSLQDLAAQIQDQVLQIRRECDQAAGPNNDTHIFYNKYADIVMSQFDVLQTQWRVFIDGSTAGGVRAQVVTLMPLLMKSC